MARRMKNGEVSVPDQDLLAVVQRFPCNVRVRVHLGGRNLLDADARIVRGELPGTARVVGVTVGDQYPCEASIVRLERAGEFSLMEGMADPSVDEDAAPVGPDHQICVIA